MHDICHEYKNLIKKILLNMKLKNVFKQENIKFINRIYEKKMQKIYFEVFNKNVFKI